jgi:RND family efflux transporter MFP subunit
MIASTTERTPMKLARAGIVVLILGSFALAQQAPPAAVKLDPVRQEIVREQVTGVATVEPWVRTTLSAEISGLVEAYPLREGDEVVANETVVCSLKHENLLIDLAEAEALLARAESESETAVATARDTLEEMAALLEQAERELQRARDLFDKQVITQAELDRTTTEATAAKSRHARAKKNYELALQGADPAAKAREAEVRRAKARLDRIRDQLSKTEIRPPVSGRVVRRLTEVGEWVNAGSPVIEIVTLSPVLVRVAVNEREIVKVKVGNPVIVRADAWPDRKFEGKVRFIAPQAAERTRSFPVLIEVPNEDQALLAGMFARVSIGCGEGRQALTVHKDAVVQTATGPVVWTLGPTTEVKMGERTFPLPTAKMIPVRIGLSVDTRMEAKGEGLAPNMPLVTTGNEQLFPGRPLIPPRPAGGAGGPPGGGGKKPEGPGKPEGGENR